MLKAQGQYDEYDTTEYMYPLDGKRINFHHWNHPLYIPQPLTQKILDKIKKYIFKDNVVVDIGAHCGWLSILYALIVEGKGEIHSFEPNEYVYNVLRKNLLSLPKENRPTLITINRAVSDQYHRGDQTYYYIDKGLCNGGFDRIAGPVEYKVATITLDDHFGQTVHKSLLRGIQFIKIDTEGHEEQILNGAKNCIEFYRPFMMIELYKFLPMEHRSSLFDTLVKLEYDCYDFSKAHYDTDRVTRILSKEDFYRLYDTHCDLYCRPSEL